MSYPRSLILSILANDDFEQLATAIASIDANDLERCGFTVSEKNQITEVEDLLAAAAARIRKIQNFLA